MRREKLEVLKRNGLKTAIDLDGFETPASRYPDGKVGRAQLKTTRYNGLYEAYGLRGYNFYVAENMPVKVLKIGRKTWMVDDVPHWWAMEEHATFYEGRVLVAGLGLGLIVHALATNPRVTHIRVIERELDVIRMIAPHLPRHPGLEIKHGDFFDERGEYEGIFYDLFVGSGAKLVHEATGVYLYLLTQFPAARTIRIHGFNNDDLAELGELVRRSRATAMEMAL